MPSSRSEDTTAGGGASDAVDGGMEAFFIPSVFGDEPQLRDLRRRLRGAFRFDLLDLPGAGAPGALLTDMAATGRALVAEIARRRPHGPVSLVGYSFGASMALEVAGQLADAGRGIAFLGVLDGPFEPPTVGPRNAAGPLAGPRRLIRSAAVEAVGSMDAVRRLVAASGPREILPPDRAEWMRRAILWHLRSKALTAWTPRGCAAPGLRVSTGAYGPANAARWAELCPGLRVVELSADHERLLEGEPLLAVSDALAAAAHRQRG